MYRDKYIKYKAKYIDIMSEINKQNLNQNGGFNEIEVSSIDHEGGGFFDKAFKIKDRSPFIEGPKDEFKIFNEHIEYSSKITGDRDNKISKLHGYFQKYKNGGFSRVVQFAVCVRYANLDIGVKELLFVSNSNFDLLAAEENDIKLIGKLYDDSNEPLDFSLSINKSEDGEFSLSYSVDDEVKYEIFDKDLKGSEILVASSASYITDISIDEKSKTVKKIRLTINGDRKKYKFTQSGLDALEAAETTLKLYSDMIEVPKGLRGMFREGEVTADKEVTVNSEEFQNYQ